MTQTTAAPNQITETTESASAQQNTANAGGKAKGKRRGAKPVVAKQLGGAIRQRNEERILRAAAEVFASAGYKGTSVQAIADKVELPKANILYYFKSKAGLYTAVLNDILEMWNQGFDERAIEREPADVIREYILAKMRYSRTRPQESKIFATEIIHGAPVIRDAIDLPMVGWTKQKASVIQAWVAQGKMRAIEPLYLLFMIWGTTQFYADFDSEITMIKGRALSDEEFSKAEDFVVETVLRGLALI
ncbi:TetR family transcriptional regulator C-terminal domain-containing protein [Aliagarivorans marinus]|uniref:TetR family transcriptional regulator C-terminal domain-containing protein n=1 Tax=Aliagarivorans marinus TaxID=561965 RepID=UPI00040B6E18|nr:TetR family transcriptional regulator C-terminal domain-containing protein [Aliagarivorans marinus]